MKKLIYIFAFIILSNNFVFSQYTFEKNFGSVDNDIAYSVIQTNDNGYFLVGSTTDYYYGDSESFIIKTNEGGDVVWSKTIGEPIYEDRAYVGIQTYDGGFATYGEKSISGDQFSYIVKCDNDGNILWSKEYRNYNGNYLSHFIQTPDSGFIFCGSNFIDPSNKLMNNNQYILKTDKYGDISWSFIVDDSYGNHKVSDIEIDYNGGYVICGEYDTQGEAHIGWFFKVDDTGNLIWTRQIGVLNNLETLKSLHKTNDYGYILCGYKHFTDIPDPESGDVYLVKTDSLGIIQWEKTIGSNKRDYGVDIDLTLDGGFVVVGYTKSFGSGGNDVYLIRTDENGDTLWTKTFGKSYNDVGYSVCSTNDGGYVLCGSFYSFENGCYNFYLIKTSESGIVTRLNELDIKEKHVDCFPNPCVDKVNITSKDQIKSVYVFNSSGKLIEINEPNTTNLILETNNNKYSAGIYYLKLVFSEYSVCKKIIVQ
jgi:hypothetical protein